ncbi:hypothetical protein PO909_032560 [Leuciscus waleckii]
MDEPEPAKGKEKDIAPEPEPHGKSDQVREPATPCVFEGRVCGVQRLGGKPRPQPCRYMASGNYMDELLEVVEEVNSLVLLPPLVPPSPEFPGTPLVLPSLSLPPPLTVSSTAPPSKEVPLALFQAYEPITSHAACWLPLGSSLPEFSLVLCPFSFVIVWL